MSSTDGRVVTRRRDADRTRRDILDVATAEFAAGALEAARRHTCEAMGEALRHVYEEAEW